MPYNNNEFEFDTAIDCTLLNKNGVKTISFKAREYAPNEKSAGFAAGGIASGDSLYIIATCNKNIARMVDDKTIKAFSSQVQIDGVIYKVAAARCERIQVADSYLKKKMKEIVITLQ